MWEGDYACHAGATEKHDAGDDGVARSRGPSDGPREGSARNTGAFVVAWLVLREKAPADLHRNGEEPAADAAGRAAGTVRVRKKGQYCNGRTDVWQTWVGGHGLQL